MLQITIPETELFDEKTESIIIVKKTNLQLEHSLVSLSKWESKWHKPFLDKDTAKTAEESTDYIRCMTLTQNVDPNVYLALTPELIEKIGKYIENPMTATWFGEDHKNGRPPKKRIITNELIYYWMVASQIPFDPCQKWHLNRLLTLIRVCGEENAPKKKMPMSDLMARNRKLNEARKLANHTNG